MPNGIRIRHENGFGHQIRCYVMQPYTLVKDLRTGVETTDIKAVLDGDIDQFLEAALARRVKFKDNPRIIAE